MKSGRHTLVYRSCDEAAIADADAEGHGELLDFREAGGGHHADHLLAADEGVYGFGEIFVSTGFVAADEGGGAGEDFAEVEIVHGQQEGIGGEGEFENDEASAGAEDALEFADGGERVGDVANAEGDGDDVAAGIGEGEGLGVAVDLQKI